MSDSPSVKIEIATGGNPLDQIIMCPRCGTQYMDRSVCLRRGLLGYSLVMIHSCGREFGCGLSVVTHADLSLSAMEHLCLVEASLIRSALEFIETMEKGRG